VDCNLEDFENARVLVDSMMKLLKGVKR